MTEPIPPITLDQFLAKLRALDTPWHLDAEDRIRTRIGARVCCPITALGKQKEMFKYRLDAEAMGLPYSDAVQIATSSDKIYDGPYNRDLRKRLLRATVDKLPQPVYVTVLRGIQTMKELKDFLRDYGGTLTDEATGMVAPPYPYVPLEHVMVSKWGVL